MLGILHLIIYNLIYRTVAAIAGDDFVVFATETRLAAGYQILSRNVPKIHKLTDLCYIGAGGCYTDIQHLQKLLDAKIDLYVIQINFLIQF